MICIYSTEVLQCEAEGCHNSAIGWSIFMIFPYMDRYQLSIDTRTHVQLI